MRALVRFAPALVLGLLLAAYFGYFIRPGLLDQGRPSLMTSWDYQSYFLPRFIHGSKEILAGHLPIWNRFEAGGMPFLATTQPAVFYPPKILFYGLLPPEAAEWSFLIFHYVLLTIGTYLLFVESGATSVGAFLGTATWIFCIPLLSSNYHPTRIACLSWVPVVLALSKRAAAGSPKALAGIALVVTLQLSAGYPEFSLDLALVVGLHAIASWGSGLWRAPPWRTGPLLAGAFVLGALGAAIQLLPLAEIAGASKRLSMAAASVSVTNLIPGATAPVLLTTPAVTGFAALGFLSRRARPAIAGWIVCTAMGAFGWKLLRLVPGFGMVRFPFVWIYFCAFYASWVVALGADEMIREGALRGRLRKLGALFVAANGLAMAACWAFAWRAFAREGYPPKYFWWPNMASPVAATVGIVAGLCLIALSIVWLRRGSVPIWAWLGLGTIIVVAHLSAVPFGAMSAPFARPYPTGEVGDFEVTDRRLAGRALSIDDSLYGYPLTDRVPSPLSVEISFLPFRQRKIVDRLHYYSMLSMIDWAAVIRARGYLDAMDVELLVTPSAFDRALVDQGLAFVRTGEGRSLFENPGRMGHAWVNFAVRRVGSDDEALDTFLGPDFDPHREALLEAPTKRQYPAPDNETLDAARPVWEIRRSDSSVEWQVEIPRPGIFIASESAYPGWTVTVDGHQAEWFVADYCLRGVELAEGTHRVRFDYRPRLIAWGAVISVVAIALTLLGLFVPSRWIRRRSS